MSQPLTIGSIPSFCINLKDRADRWNTMMTRFAAHGLQVERWDASTPDRTLGNYVDYLKPTQRACTYSHISLFLHIMQMGYPCAFIMEDDAVFRHDWKEIVNEKLAAIEREDPEWDALFLNVAEETVPLESWQPARDQCLAGAYIIRRKAIEYILQTHWSQFYCIDWMTQILQARGHSYTYFPWLAIQDGSTSTIQNGTPDADYAKVVRLLAWAGYPLDAYS